MNRIKTTMRGLYMRGVIYWIAYKAGNRIIRESTGTRDRKLAEAALAKRRAEVFEGRWRGRIRDTKTPIEQAMREFMTVYSQPRKVSWQDDQLMLSRFAAFLGRHCCLQDVDRRLIEQFQLHLLASGVSKARVNRYIATLKCFFNRCIDWHRIQSNPCRGIRLYPEQARTQWLESGQIARLFEHCSPRVKPIVGVALLTGLRRGDILRLTWDRIDFEQNLIRVTQGKTQSSLVLPMSEQLAEVLRSVPRDLDCPYVFNERGKPLCRYGWVRTDFARAARAAGLTGTRFHDLRHTAATQLRRLGRDLQVVQQLLGHKSIRTTLRYSHVHPTELRDAVNRLGEKILPVASHFTITSQSAEAPEGAGAPSVQNDANFQSESKMVRTSEEGMPQTVKQGRAPSERPAKRGLPSSR